MKIYNLFWQWQENKSWSLDALSLLRYCKGRSFILKPPWPSLLTAVRRKQDRTLSRESGSLGLTYGSVPGQLWSWMPLNLHFISVKWVGDPFLSLLQEHRSQKMHTQQKYGPFLSQPSRTYLWSRIVWIAGLPFKQALENQLGWRDFSGIINTHRPSSQCHAMLRPVTCSVVQKLQHNRISSLRLHCCRHSGIKNGIQTLPHVRVNYHRLRKMGAVSFHKGFHSGWVYGQAGGTGGHCHFQGLRRRMCVVQRVSPAPMLKNKGLFLSSVKKKENHWCCNFSWLKKRN